MFRKSGKAGQVMKKLQNVAKAVKKEEKVIASVSGKQGKPVRGLSRATGGPGGIRGAMGSGGKYVNAYADSLLDPVSNPGVRIPDFNAVPSATFTLVDRRTVTVPANPSNVCICYGNDVAAGTTHGVSLVPTINSATGVTNVGFIAATTATTVGAITNGASLIQLEKWTTGSDTVPTIYTHARLVSAAMTVTALGALSTTQGKFSGAFYPKAALNDNFGQVGQTLTMVEETPGSSIVPVNKEQGITVLYKPTDMDTLEFIDLSSVDLAPIEAPWAFPGAFLVFASGLTPGVVLQVSTVLNYEALVAQNSESFGMENVSPSPVDPIALAAGFNAAARAPSTGMTDAALFGGYGRSPNKGGQTATVRQEGFGEMLMNGIVKPAVSVFGRGIETLGSAAIGGMGRQLNTAMG